MAFARSRMAPPGWAAPKLSAVTGLEGKSGWKNGGFGGWNIWGNPKTVYLCLFVKGDMKQKLWFLRYFAPNALVLGQFVGSKRVMMTKTWQHKSNVLEPKWPRWFQVKHLFLIILYSPKENYCCDMLLNDEVNVGLVCFVLFGVLVRRAQRLRMLWQESTQAEGYRYSYRTAKLVCTITTSRPKRNWGRSRFSEGDVKYCKDFDCSDAVPWSAAEQQKAFSDTQMGWEFHGISMIWVEQTGNKNKEKQPTYNFYDLAVASFLYLENRFYLTFVRPVSLALEAGLWTNKSNPEGWKPCFCSKTESASCCRVFSLDRPD